MLTCPHVGVAVQTRDEFGAAAKSVLSLLSLPARSRLYLSSLSAAHFGAAPRPTFLSCMRDAVRCCFHPARSGRGPERMGARASATAGDYPWKPASAATFAARVLQDLVVPCSGILKSDYKNNLFLYRDGISLSELYDPPSHSSPASNFCPSKEKFCHGQGRSSVPDRHLYVLHPDLPVRPRMSALC